MQRVPIHLVSSILGPTETLNFLSCLVFLPSASRHLSLPLPLPLLLLLCIVQTHFNSNHTHTQIQISSSLMLLPLLLLVAFPSLTHPTFAHTCPPPSSCPPFTASSPLPFPFSSSPGCGHPDFQIHCSQLHSTISINNFSFAVLSHEPNSTSLNLSALPHSPTPSHSLCSSSSLPNRSISLSNTPFRFSETSCNKLSLLRSCSPRQIPNCSLCSWECELFKYPVRLLHGCQPKRHIESDRSCKPDILSHLDTFLESGFQVEWNQTDSFFTSCKLCQSLNGVCGYNSSDPVKRFVCYNSEFQSHKLHSSAPPPPWIRRDSPNRIVMLCTLFICTCVLLLVAIATFIYRFKGSKSSQNEEDPTMLFLRRHCSANLLPPVFSYEELEASSNQFDPRRKIGDGGFGSVYLGQLNDGRIVAVKKLHRPQKVGRAASMKSFCNEILILSSIHHSNLVKLHGYCSDPRGLLLVYDYVPNGTLADHLHGSKRFYRKEGSLKSLQVRVEVALQTAMALEYLHFSVEPAIIHRDITSSNIFIEKDMRIKVGDFGLSRLLVFPDSTSSSSGYICTGPQGTPGYLDPDYHRSFRLTEKSDVYSFGVVLFELISGMKAVDLNRDKREVALADMVVSKIQVGSLHQVVDPVLLVEGNAMGPVDAMAELAFRCVAVDKDDRPNSREIVAELKRIRNSMRGHHSCNSDVPILPPSGSKS